MSKRGKRRAFTLIEVLVVVAIIALLVAILIPSLSKAREQARITACNANLHDLGTSIHLYSIDHSPYFPLVPYMGSVTTSPISDDNLFVLWHRKYARATSSFTCPSTKHRIRAPDRIEKVPTTWGQRYDIYTQGNKRNDFAYLAEEREDGFGSSYEYNTIYDYPGRTLKVTWYHAEAPFTVSNSMLKTSATRFPQPAFDILMHDGDDGGNVVGSNGDAINNYPEPWDNHGKSGMNILFADGHTTWVRTFDLEPAGSGGKIWRRMEHR